MMSSNEMLLALATDVLGEDAGLGACNSVVDLVEQALAEDERNSLDPEENEEFGLPRFDADGWSNFFGEDYKTMPEIVDAAWQVYQCLPRIEE